MSDYWTESYPVEAAKPVRPMPEADTLLRDGASFIGLALLVAVGWWVASSALEARAFNRVTSREVTTWDAMFLDLRVTGEAP